MKNSLTRPLLADDELRGFSRTVAEIEWLTVILVLLNQIAFSPVPEATSSIMIGTVVFSAFVLSFHYFNFYRRESTWKLAVEAAVMTAFITWVLLHTGRFESPLVNLYLLVVIMAALTLGKSATLVQIALIAVCYLVLAQPLAAHAPSMQLPKLVTFFGPLVLVAYITTMLSSDVRRALVHVKDLSETDELTGVLNMRAFAAIAERLSKQAVRYKRPYTVLMIDSDNLKSINDEFGHEAGNRLLKMLAQCMKAELRATDIVARYGGDEFILLLPETGAAGGEKLAARIRQRVEQAVLSTRSRPVTTTVSVGIASQPEHGSDFAAITERADQALYRSKTAGKNRVTVAPSVAYIAAAAQYLR